MKKNSIYPNFFIVGVPKAGTSSIGHYLNQHPDVYISSIKEPFFFSKDICEKDFDSDYRRRAALDVDAYLRHSPLPKKHIAHITDYSHYMELFRDVEKEKAIGELSTGYLYSSQAAEEIFRFNPAAKIVMVLRHPVERAYSHYQMHIRDFMQFDYNFLSALEEDISTVEKGWGKSHLYVELGLYFNQVKRYLDLFPKEQVKIFLYEDLQRDQAQFMEELFTFLEVDTLKSAAINYSERKNSARYPKVKISKNLAGTVNFFRNYIARKMPDKIKDLIRVALFSNKKLPRLQRHEFAHALKLFEADIQKLSILTKRDLQSWLQWPGERRTLPVAKNPLKVLVVTNMYPSAGEASWRGVFIKEQIDTLSAMFDDIYFDVLQIKGGGAKGGWKINYLLALWRYFGMLKKSKYDIVWAHHSLCVFLAAMHKNIPLLYSIHEGGIGMRSKVSSVNGALKLSNHALYVNKDSFDTSEHANKYFCPSGVDIGKFRCLDRGECRLKLGLDPDKYYVFFPASPERPEKNAAFAYSFMEKNPAWLTSENIDFVFGGDIENDLMPTWMNAVDCLVSFSNYESDGMVFKEAMACNLPVVSFSVGNAPIYFKGNVAGSIIARDHEELKRSICYWKQIGRSKGRDHLLFLQMDRHSVAHQIRKIFEAIVRRGAA